MVFNLSTSNSVPVVVFTDPQRIVYAIITGIIIVLNLIANTATIIAFCKVPGLRMKPSDLLILNLSIADLGMGCLQAYFCLPQTQILRFWPFGKVGCQIGDFTGITLICVGFMTTLAIVFDRFLLITMTYPKYVKMQSRLRIMLTMLVTWLYGFVIGATDVAVWDFVKIPTELDQFFDYSKKCRSPPQHNAVYSLFMYSSTVFLPLLGIETFSILFVILLYRKLRRSVVVEPSNDSRSRESASLDARDNNGLKDASENDRNSAGDSRKRYRKAAAVLGALVIVLNLCLLPFILYSLSVSLFCPQCYNVLVREILLDVIYLNSCINPFMYAVTMSKIRNFYKCTVCRR